MNCKFPIFCIIFNLFCMDLLSSASCLRSTRDMWQLQPPKEMGSCNRPSPLRSEFDDKGTVPVAAALNNGWSTLGNFLSQYAVSGIDPTDGQLKNKPAKIHRMSI
ncbi:uncharacterized protein LOC108154509 isoform X2 [Drosophila miranda]|uniref:uncharacterized protein LOC108154509 isoform X2 n=1 Tax=Drosophila miranda TaxID=7229 RepID=UPI0007E7EDDE|nr:uncharacterized protein LOC108154509 isoform X2 [Drosophila miranda]